MNDKSEQYPSIYEVLQQLNFEWRRASSEYDDAIDAILRNDIDCKSIRVDNLTIDDSIVLRGVPLKDVCLGGRDIRSRLSTLKLGGPLIYVKIYCSKNRGILYF